MLLLLGFLEIYLTFVAIIAVLSALSGIVIRDSSGISVDQLLKSMIYNIVKGNVGDKVIELTLLFTTVTFLAIIHLSFVNVFHDITRTIIVIIQEGFKPIENI